MKKGCTGEDPHVMDIDVQIEGIANLTIAEAIRTRIRRISRADARRGEWRVTVSPSETRGQWDLGVQGPSGRHFDSFTEAVDRLPDLIERKFREIVELPSTNARTLND
jgi:hypothetical protein